MDKKILPLTQRERGSVLLGTILLSLLFLAILIGYSQVSTSNSEALVHQTSTQRALEYAESGANNASLWLKNPSFNLQLPINTSTTVVFGPYQNGRVETTFYRMSTDSNLVDSYTTGYYYLAKGSFVDTSTMTSQNAQIAVVNVKFRITNLAQFMFAVPGPLTITYGSNISNGIVYANDLTISTGSALPHTKIASAWYSNTVSSMAPVGVDFLGDPPAPQKLSYSPNFARLDSNVRAFYESKKSATLPDFQGVVSAASDSHVYFSSGDLHIGQGQALTVSGVYVIYATGSVYIHNDIQMADANSWIGILSEKDIHLAADIPGNTLTLNGNFVANWGFRADGPPRSASVLTINGGIVSYTAAQLSNVWAVRNYNYQTTTDSNLLMPNFSVPIEYKILKGKFDH
jgi:hypothetical protein